MSSSTTGLIPRGKHTITVDGVRQVSMFSVPGPSAWLTPEGRASGGNTFASRPSNST